MATEADFPGRAAAAGAVGTLADQGAGQVLLPQFVSQGPAGLFVDSARMAGAEEFARFVDRVFSTDVVFAGLDYAVFAQLLHEGRAEPAVARLAVGLRPFPAERRPLYKGVKIAADGMSAEYVFEPVTLDVTTEVPVLGEPGPDGQATVLRHELVSKSVPARLDADEFVADLWGKGVRYGIDIGAVRAVIDKGETVRLDVAHGLAPTAGRDATLEEKTQALHRDDSPRILANGKIDLKQFKNRFPQIVGGSPLLRKIPRVLGKPGRKVSGEIIEPDLPKDFDLASLAGPGTRVDQRGDGEYIVSAREGFLNLDVNSNEVSITEKIVNRDGISARTTGDLALAGDEFEEHGDVQERRVVQGKHMTFVGDVYGAIVSSGGRIRLVGNISGGRASSPGGSIEAEARASSATLEAPGGEIRAKDAEGCTLVADTVIVERAVLCQIVARRVEVGQAEGCAIAGQAVKVGNASDRRDQETLISMLVPDFQAVKKRLAELTAESAEIEAVAGRKATQAAEIRGNPEMAGFLALEARIGSGAVALSPAQEKNWGKALARFGPLQRHLSGLEADLAGQRGQLGRLAEERAALEGDMRQQAEGIACVVEAVGGDTAVRTLSYRPDLPLLTGGQVQDILARLRAFGQAGDRLFTGASGSFSWHYELPPAE